MSTVSSSCVVWPVYALLYTQGSTSQLTQGRAVLKGAKLADSHGARRSSTEDAVFDGSRCSRLRLPGLVQAVDMQVVAVPVPLLEALELRVVH